MHSAAIIRCIDKISFFNGRSEKRSSRLRAINAPVRLKPSARSSSRRCSSSKRSSSEKNGWIPPKSRAAVLQKLETVIPACAAASLTICNSCRPIQIATVVLLSRCPVMIGLINSSGEIPLGLGRMPKERVISLSWLSFKNNLSSYRVKAVIKDRREHKPTRQYHNILISKYLFYLSRRFKNSNVIMIYTKEVTIDTNDIGHWNHWVKDRSPRNGGRPTANSSRGGGAISAGKSPVYKHLHRLLAASLIVPCHVS